MKIFALKALSVFTAFSVLSKCFGLVKVYKKNGDFIVGGLAAFHLNFAETGDCGSIHTLGALRRGEAMAYATSKINNDSNILDGYTLGYEIYDVCGSQEQTLKHALLFLPPFRSDDDVLGVVGPERSSSSIQATYVLGLYNISLVSYLSTSDELSNSDRFPYFFRTVPPDKFQVSAIIDILVNFNWTYVAFIYSDDSYGRNAEAEFQAQAEDNNICVAFSNKLVFPGTNDYRSSLQGTIRRLIDLKETSLLSVAILFLQFEVVRDFFALAREEGIDRDFIWIGSDGWGLYDLEPVSGSESTAVGAFTIIPKAAPHQEFEEYFKKILKSSSNDNPWLPEFSTNPSICEMQRTMCTFHDDPGLSFASLVIDSVEVLARGLDAMRKELCTGSMNMKACRSLLLSNRRLLRDHFLNVTYYSSSNGLVKFTADGDAMGRYQIRYLNQDENDDYNFDEVGTWTETGNDQGLELDDVDWYLKRSVSSRGSTYSDSNVPKSVCSDPCEPLQVQSGTILDCCWTCSVCMDNEIIVDNECVSCFIVENRTYMWPDETLSYCRKLDYVKLRDEVSKVLPLLLAVLGLVPSTIIAYLYIKYRNKRLIKASSRELGYIVLVGVFLLHLSAILYSTPPVNITCYLRRIVPHIANSFIYVSLATMTIRLYRIFESGKKTTKRPKFISPVTQVMITLVLSLLPQLTWGILWILVEPPNVSIIKPTAQRQAIEMMCTTSIPHEIGQLCWDLFVVSICCVFAVLARKLPTNYNQTRFIGFCVFSTLVVLIAFAPAFFTSQVANQQDLYTAIGAIIQSTVVLVLIFGVKIYAIYTVKEGDQHVLTTASGTVTKMKNAGPSETNVNSDDNRKASIEGDTKTKSPHTLPAPCPASPTVSKKQSYDIATQTCEKDASADSVYISDGPMRTLRRLYDSKSIEIGFDLQGEGIMV
ncbi:Metabotropic glutamate receptor 3 [Holothuria leucospilota]|uniref:Metabotropic glutamate receptor 3 n=1 Tax=Holothuria leucospilota TaxID=206669 RepID=A0A9Q1C3J7_HOLLE|nr:Metabotropic glutamate receptor 3 [Holothuria leucospilota]